jgi:acyl-CoA synthetase (AMP-forming)/AMP-acid ligase II
MLLHDTFDYSARENPGVEFAIQGARSLSYRDAQALANRMANALVARGLAPGDRVALLSKNSIEHALWYYACSKAGVVTVPLNYRLAPPEWSYILDDSGAKLVFAQDALAEALAPARGGLAAVKHWIALGADVPVVPGYLDFRRKRAGFGPAIRMTGDVHADMDKIRAFYETQAPTALEPDHFGPIRLREEAGG